MADARLPTFSTDGGIGLNAGTPSGRDTASVIATAFDFLYVAEVAGSGVGLSGGRLG